MFVNSGMRISSYESYSVVISIEHSVKSFKEHLTYGISGVNIIRNDTDNTIILSIYFKM